MATCKMCGKSHFGLFELKNGHCKDCQDKAKVSEQERQQRIDEFAKTVDLDSILATTENHDGFNIVARHGVVTAECAMGINIFKDVFAGVRDITGGRSAAVQNALKDAKHTVIAELKREAVAAGGNAVVAIDLDYLDLSTTGSMLLMVASGTAVTVE